ncbi:hypothetical protein O0L34_g10872 [Tuta absoluta]|nr:hypothetical protein O0L34_g10872 [Tuta absoluta]
MIVSVCYVYTKLDEKKELSRSKADIERKDDGLEQLAEAVHSLKYSDDENVDEHDSLGFNQEVIQRPMRAVVRCTRRFSTGLCNSPVVSVWTYEFDQQNCTERFGCPEAERSNRFKNYNNCRRICMTISIIYSRVLNQMPKHEKPPRRFAGTQLNDSKDFEDLPPLSETYSDNEKRPLARQYHDYVERQKLLSYDDYTMPAGADDFVPIDIDEFRVQPEVLADFYRNFN